MKPHNVQRTLFCTVDDFKTDIWTHIKVDLYNEVPQTYYLISAHGLSCFIYMATAWWSYLLHYGSSIVILGFLNEMLLTFLRNKARQVLPKKGQTGLWSPDSWPLQLAFLLHHILSPWLPPFEVVLSNQSTAIASLAPGISWRVLALDCYLDHRMEGMSVLFIELICGSFAGISSCTF